MPAPKNLAGMRFGELVVTVNFSRDGNGRMWLCDCDCGGKRWVRTYFLTSGKVRHCSQLRHPRRRNFQGHKAQATHLYDVWANTRRSVRCRSGASFAAYGAKGIGFSPEWNRFVDFRDWALSSGYEKGARLRRHDRDGHFEPGNCYWEPWAPPRRPRL